MRYALVLPDGQVSRSMEFNGPPPNLNPVKGRWLPDTPPAFDARTQSSVRVEKVAPGEESVTYQIKPRRAEDVLTAKLRELAAIRGLQESKNIKVNGDTLFMDADSRARLLASMISLQQGFVQQVDFKTPDGWVTLSLAQAVAMTRAMLGQIQACAARERELHTAIMKLSDNPVALAAVDISKGWP